MNASDPTGPRAFHLARSHTVVALGRVAPVAGVGLLLVLLVPALLDPGAPRTALLAVAWTVLAVGAVLTALAGVRVLRSPVIVRLDDEGLEVRVLRGAGPAAVLWTAVRTVRRETLRPGPCVVVGLADGRRTVVPERLVDEGGDALADALRGRLDAARGQRRLTRSEVAGGGETSDGRRDGGSGGGGGGGI